MRDFKYYLDTYKEIGFVEQINYGTAILSGLPHVYPHEIVIFENGDLGYVLSLKENFSEVLLFSKEHIKAGLRAARTKEFLSVTLGSHLVGKTIDPFGKPLNSFIGINDDDSNQVNRRIDQQPWGIDKRKRIESSFETGVSLVDLVLPLGKGQRQLIVGDRKSGKTNFLLQTILAQSRKGTICIYVGIGKKQLSIRKVEEFILENKITDTCLIVASRAEDPAGIIYLTPYTGMTVAEYFRDQGKDVLIILDDLTTHARYYREISLLIKRFPGRNSYPADIFYAHSKLLERAGNFKVKVGADKEVEASITCLPVAETIQGDLSGYIQTNLMSMTDGHLYFDSDLFAKGRRPAIHPFLSVTRVGRQTQTALRQTLNREITSFLSMYEKMQNFTHFGAEISDTVTNALAMGAKIIRFFEQIRYEILELELQILLFSLVWIDVWHDKTLDQMKEDMTKIANNYRNDEQLRKEVHEAVDKSESFNQLLGEIRGKTDEFYKKLGLA